MANQANKITLKGALLRQSGIMGGLRHYKTILYQTTLSWKGPYKAFPHRPVSMWWSTID
jgi:hypothetical protein